MGKNEVKTIYKSEDKKSNGIEDVTPSDDLSIFSIDLVNLAKDLANFDIDGEMGWDEFKDREISIINKKRKQHMYVTMNSEENFNERLEYKYMSQINQLKKIVNSKLSDIIDREIGAAFEDGTLPESIVIRKNLTKIANKLIETNRFYNISKNQRPVSWFRSTWKRMFKR